MIPLFKVSMAVPEAIGRLREVLYSGFIGQGTVVEEFEREFEKHAPYGVVSMNSCTSAIHAVLMHLGVGPGDEVITTPLTCIASNAPILAVGARPVWADVSPVTGNIDSMDVWEKVTPRTKAIIAVDWAGRSANYGALRKAGVPIIQDAAHRPLIGADWCGDYVCYSFGPIKHFTTGDGGAVSCADPATRASLRLLRWYGLDRTSGKDFRCAQDIARAGMKFHMNDINAAIGLANMPHLLGTVEAHRANARQLYERLPITMQPPFDKDSNYWVFPILTDRRDEVKAYLATRGIQASQVHARNDKHTAYNFPNGPLPGLDAYDARQLNIPCGWWLTSEDIEKIVAAVLEFPQ